MFKRNDGSGNQQIRMAVDLRQCESIRCKNCNGELFTTAMILKKVPALISPTGKDEIIPISVFVCKSCHIVLMDE